MTDDIDVEFRKHIDLLLDNHKSLVECLRILITCIDNICETCEDVHKGADDILAADVLNVKAAFMQEGGLKLTNMIFDIIGNSRDEYLPVYNKFIELNKEVLDG